MHHASQAKASSSLQHDVWGVLLVSTGGNPCVSAPIYPDTPSVKGHGETDMEDHDTSHHYMCSFHIVAALFLVMEAIK